MKEWKCKDCCCFETDACPYPYVQEHYNSCARVVIQHDEAYAQGRAEGYSQAENDYHKQTEKDRQSSYDCGYEKGRADKYQEIVSGYRLLTEEQVAEIRADAIDEYKVKCQQKFKDLQFETGRAWFDFDAGIDRCLEILDKVAEQLKE